MEKHEVKCVVATINHNCQPDLFACKVICSVDQIDDKDHHRKAKDLALKNSHHPILVYDDKMPAGLSLSKLFDWEKILAIEI